MEAKQSLISEKNSLFRHILNAPSYIHCCSWYARIDCRIDDIVRYVKSEWKKKK